MTEQSIRAFLRTTRFLVPLPGRNLPKESGLAIEPKQVIWVGEILAYRLFERPYSRGIDNFVEFSASHLLLRHVYDGENRIDPIIRTKLGDEFLYNHCIKNPDALLEMLYGQDVEVGPDGKAKEAGFRMIPESRMVCKDGIEYKLTKNQFEVIKLLYDAHQAEVPGLTWDAICEKIGISKSQKMFEVFRKKSDARKALITYDKRLRLYRLDEGKE